MNHGTPKRNQYPRNSGTRPSREEVLEQLERILCHEEFLATDKMRDFLCFVVEETLAGRKQTLKGYTVATRLFGRGEDFDAAHDPIVSIQAGRLRRALERYYLVAGTEDPVHIDIPKGRYVPRFTSRINQVDRQRATESASPRSGRQSTVRPSIAVLPFENHTDDPEQRFLTLGLTDELATEMSRFQDLLVIPCQFMNDPDERGAHAGEIDPRGGARFLLQGTVRKDEDSVKVSAHLTDATTGRQVWADAYTHPPEASRMIATQEEIARKVVAAVGSEYGIIPRRLSAESRKKPPEELGTYEAMLRYYSHQITPSPESSRHCFTALHLAAEREPEYGPVWSALATLYCQVHSMDRPGFDNPLETGLEFAWRGVSLEPGAQLGRLILAYASYLADDSEVFLEEIENALALNRNSPYALGTAGYFHVMRGDFDLGMPLLDRALELSPCHPTWFHGAYVVDHLRHHDYEHALQELERYSPFQDFWSPVAHCAILGKLGRIDEARTHLERVEKQKPDFAARARQLFWRTLKIDPIIDDLMEGLSQAGMQIEAN